MLGLGESGCGDMWRSNVPEGVADIKRTATVEGNLVTMKMRRCRSSSSSTRPTPAC